MKKLASIFGLCIAIIAVILAVTPLSNFAIMPIIIAFICGLYLVFLSNKIHQKIKPIQYIFLLTIIALTLTIYKGVFKASEVSNTEAIEQREDEHLLNAKDELETMDVDENL